MCFFTYGHCRLGAKGSEKVPVWHRERGSKAILAMDIWTHFKMWHPIEGLLSFFTFRDVVSTPVINCAYQIQPRATPFSWCRSSEGGIKAELPPPGPSPWLQRLGSVRTWLPLPCNRMPQNKYLSSNIQYYLTQQNWSITILWSSEVFFYWVGSLYLYFCSVSNKNISNRPKISTA